MLTKTAYPTHSTWQLPRGGKGFAEKAALAQALSGPSPGLAQAVPRDQGFSESRIPMH